jgi:hypothetical protein
MKTTLLNIDIQGFNKQAQHQSEDEIRDYLVGYYEAVEQECVKYKWQIIKTMGDCVFVNSESKLTSETSLHLKYLFEILKPNYPILIRYRECEIERASINLGAFFCNDVFGKDVNNLFLNDEFTHRMG